MGAGIEFARPLCMTMLFHNFLPDSPSPFPEMVLLHTRTVFNSIVLWSLRQYGARRY